MMRFILFAVFLFITIDSFGQDYFFTNYNDAKEVAQSNGKRLFVDFSAVWCQPCKFMEQEVFPKENVKSYLEKDYICVKLHKSENEKLFKQFGVKNFPTYVIFDTSDKEIHRWSGASNSELFIDNFKNLDERMGLESKLETQNNDLYILYKYYASLMKSKDQKKAATVAIQILSQSKDWSEKRNMSIIVEHLNNPKFKKYYLSNIAKFSKQLDTDDYYPKILKYYYRQNYLKYKDEKTIPIESIKSEFIKLYGSKNYVNYYNSFLVSVIANKPNHEKLYHSTFIDLVSNKPGLFQKPFSYDALSKMIIALNKKRDLSKLYKGFQYQLGLKDVVINYYDLKALLEYRLGKKSAMAKTIAKMEQISKEEYGGAFESELEWLIEGDGKVSR